MLNDVQVADVLEMVQLRWGAESEIRWYVVFQWRTLSGGFTEYMYIYSGLVGR